jgi:hypothetical protein
MTWLEKLHNSNCQPLAWQEKFFILFFWQPCACIGTKRQKTLAASAQGIRTPAASNLN